MSGLLNEANQSVLRIYSGSGTQSSFVEQSEDSEMTECKISFLSQKSTAGAADMPDSEQPDSASFCFTSLTLQMRLAAAACSVFQTNLWPPQRRVH